jgi:hypothetical protein
VASISPDQVTTEGSKNQTVTLLNPHNERLPGNTRAASHYLGVFEAACRRTLKEEHARSFWQVTGVLDILLSGGG